MIGVDCSELTGDEMLALASAISDGLEGEGVAIVKDCKILVDQVSKSKISVAAVVTVVEGFVARRKDPTNYSLEISMNNIIVHSRRLRNAGGKETIRRLPPGFLQCSLCGFLTKDREQLTIHIRQAHEVIR